MIIATSAFLLICAYYKFSSVHMVAVLMPLVVLGVAGGGSVFSRVMSSRIMVFLGLISYSIYLVHMPIYFFFSVNFPTLRTDQPYLYAFAIISTLLVFSAGTFYLVELPSKKLIRFIFFSKAKKTDSAKGKDDFPVVTTDALSPQIVNKS